MIPNALKPDKKRRNTPWQNATQTHTRSQNSTEKIRDYMHGLSKSSDNKEQSEPMLSDSILKIFREDFIVYLATAFIDSPNTTTTDLHYNWT